MMISDTITLGFRNANSPESARTQIQCTVLDHARVPVTGEDLVTAVRTDSHELYVATLGPMGSTTSITRVENVREAVRRFNDLLEDDRI